MRLPRGISSLVIAACLLSISLWNSGGVRPAEAAPSPQVSPTPDCRTVGPLSVCLRTDKRSYSQGEPVQMTLDITALQSVSGWHQTTCEYDFGVESQSQQQIWRYLYQRACGDVAWRFTLGAGQTLTYTTTWNQMDDSGNQIPPGDYLAWGQGMFCLDAPSSVCDPMSSPVPISIISPIVSADPVGGIAEPPETAKSAGRPSSLPIGALAGISAAGVIALGGGAWYARRRWLS
jgi:hypothetical protein